MAGSDAKESLRAGRKSNTFGTCVVDYALPLVVLDRVEPKTHERCVNLGYLGSRDLRSPRSFGTSGQFLELQNSVLDAVFSVRTRHRTAQVIIERDIFRHRHRNSALRYTGGRGTHRGKKRPKNFHVDESHISPPPSSERKR